MLISWSALSRLHDMSVIGMALLKWTPDPVWQLGSPRIKPSICYPYLVPYTTSVPLSWKYYYKHYENMFTISSVIHIVRNKQDMRYSFALHISFFDRLGVGQSPETGGNDMSIFRSQWLCSRPSADGRTQLYMSIVFQITSPLAHGKCKMESFQCFLWVAKHEMHHEPKPTMISCGSYCLIWGIT